MKLNEGSLWRIGEIMIQKGWLTWAQLNDALSLHESTGRKTGEILVETGLVTRRNVFRALAVQHGMAFGDLQTVIPQQEALTMIPKRLAYQYQILPLVLREHMLLIAVGDPLNLWLEKEIQTLTQIIDVRSVLSPPQDIETALEKYYGREGITFTRQAG